MIGSEGAGVGFVATAGASDSLPQPMRAITMKMNRITFMFEAYQVEPFKYSV